MSMLLYLAALATPVQAPEAPAVGDAFVLEPPAVGDVFASKAQKFRGWWLYQTGFVEEYGWALFIDKEYYLLASTSAARRNADGGIETERINATLLAHALPGEEEIEGGGCLHQDDGSPQLVFFNLRRREARGYFVALGKIVEKRWYVADPRDCADPDP